MSPFGCHGARGSYRVSDPNASSPRGKPNSVEEADGTADNGSGVERGESSCMSTSELAEAETSVCERCEEMFPEAELTCIDLGAPGPGASAELRVCEACLDNFAQCYRCRLWFARRKLNGLYDEMVDELYSPEALADLNEDGHIPERVCYGCEWKWLREHPPESPQASAGTHD